MTVSFVENLQFHNTFGSAGIGSYETGFNENDDNARYWRLPNVIGIAKCRRALANASSRLPF